LDKREKKKGLGKGERGGGEFSLRGRKGRPSRSTDKMEGGKRTSP